MRDQDQIERLLLLGLSTRLSITARRFESIVSDYGSVKKAILDNFQDSSIKDFLDCAQLSFDEVLSFGEAAMELHEARGIGFLTVFDDQYPSALKDLKDYPVIIYFRGNVSLLSSDESYRLGCIGSRVLSHQTHNFAQRLFSELVLFNPIIVSGLAVGADELAHKLALEKSLSCVGVIGSSLDDNEYNPYATKQLFATIIQNGGLVLSEYPIGTKPQKYNFVRRNRILAALSKGIFVLQARIKSGSLVTAGKAMELGRDLFVVPGWGYDPAFKGSQDLLRKGAVPVFECEDLRPFLNLEVIKSDNQRLGVSTKQKVKPEYEVVLNALSIEPMNIDELVIRSNLTVHNLSILLSEMELFGMVKNVGLNNWVLIL